VYVLQPLAEDDLRQLIARAQAIGAVPAVEAAAADRLIAYADGDARRFIRMAAEDIGLADPRALRLALDAAEVFERLGSPEGELALAECVVYLAVAPKSNAVYKAFNEAKAFVKKDGTRPVPMHLRNAPTKLMKELDYGKGYRYAHDEADGFAAGENYLPEGMAEPGFYRPVERGLEIRIADKLRELKKVNNQKN